MTAHNYFVLSSPTARRLAAERCDTAEAGWQVSFKPAKRSDEQNALMWVKLQDLAEQVYWPVWTGSGWSEQLLSKEDWKEVLTAARAKGQRMVQAIEGSGFVMLGEPTKHMTIGEMTELIDLIQHFGDSKGVEWTPDPHPERRR